MFQVKALEAVWWCWYLVFLVVGRAGDSLEMRHFNHLNGWLIVSSLASECKASAWKTQQRGGESVRERGDDGRQEKISFLTPVRRLIHLISLYCMVSFNRAGESKLPTTYSQCLLLIPAFLSQLSSHWSRHYAGHQGAHLNKTRMPFRCIVSHLLKEQLIWCCGGHLGRWPV